MSSVRVLAGKWKGRPLAAPKSGKTRPTMSQVRAAVFNIWQNHVSGSTFLDLFAGTGAMGLEALSLGAQRCDFVEGGLQACRCIEENCSRLECSEQIEIYHLLVERFLKNTKLTYDLIFVDPPYDWAPKDKEVGHRPGQYVKWLMRNLAPRLRKGGQLMIEQACTARELVSSAESLILLETRSYGDSLIHRFESC